MAEIKETISDLKKNEAFQMSLSGKELFHSNMIAMFLNQDNYPDLSIAMMKLFPPVTMNEYKEYNQLPDKSKEEKQAKEKYIRDNIAVFDVLREYQNLDLLICYCTKKDKEELVTNKINSISDISDLDEHGNEGEASSNGGSGDSSIEDLLGRIHYVIVENKFKSFPYKEQLDKYSQKVIDGMVIVSFKKEGSNRKTYIKTKFDEKNKNTTCYLLAPEGSLQAFYNNYPDKLFGNSNKIEWFGISYETYNEQLKPYGNEKSEKLMPQFIYKYREFLTKMIFLYEECVEKRIKKNCFINSEYNKYLLQGRIQDFYEKIIYNRLLTKLRIETIISPNTETKSLKNPKDGEWPFFNSNAYYSNQTGYLDFRYVWENSDINAGIQIQGSSFRIVFCHEKDLLKKVYGLSSFKSEVAKKYFENRDRNREKRETLDEFNKDSEITITMACIKYIYEKINENLPDKKLPKLQFKDDKKNKGKETVYSYSVSNKYNFRYGNCDLNDISPNNDYRELDYETLKVFIRESLNVIKQKSYEELKNNTEIKKLLLKI